MSLATLAERPTRTDAAHRGAREVLSFRLGSEEYGIDILKVQEIRGYGAPIRMANAPTHVKGVVNLRGEIVPIVDLRIRFGLTSVAYDGLTVIIVLNVRGRTVGIVVDSVSDVLELTAGQIKPAPELQCAADAGHITGLGCVTQADTQRMLILMDIENLLADASIGLTDPAHEPSCH